MSFQTIDERYEHLLAGTGPSEIRLHLPRLRELASSCDRVVEFGVNTGQSTTALAAGRPKVLTCVDLFRAPEAEEIERLAVLAGVDFRFHEGDSRAFDFDWTDMLFVDTTHTGEHLRDELRKASRVRRWIVLHDTISAGKRGWWYRNPQGMEMHGPGVSYRDHGRKVRGGGLLDAVYEFLAENPEWTIAEHDDRSHGLMRLDRI